MKVSGNQIAEKKVTNLIVSTSKPQLVKQWLQIQKYREQSILMQSSK
jgi:hypothetical protein